MRPLAASVCVLTLFLSACGATGEERPDTVPPAATVSVPGTPTDGTGGTSDSPEASAETETPAILDFTSTTVDGAPFEGTLLAGHPTVFWFWPPQCSTCPAQIPVVSEIADRYTGRVNVVGVGSLGGAETMAEFAGSVSPQVTLLSDADGEVRKHLGASAEATYLVLDADGHEQASGPLDDAALARLAGELAG